MYRPDLPEGMPDRIARLPVHRGYPVPWFVAWLAPDGKTPVIPGSGTPEFRVTFPRAAYVAHTERRCWICGDRLGSWKAFVAGPMCGINRNSSEPPAHRDCAVWASIACPFLARPHMDRREAGMPEDGLDPPGIALKRNPGVAMVWITKRYSVRYLDPQQGILFDIGDPSEVEWYAHGRAATRAEVMESVETGLPFLRELAQQQGPMAERLLDRYIERFLPLVPAA